MISCSCFAPSTAPAWLQRVEVVPARPSLHSNLPHSRDWMLWRSQLKSTQVWQDHMTMRSCIVRPARRSQLTRSKGSMQEKKEIKPADRLHAGCNDRQRKRLAMLPRCRRHPTRHGVWRSETVQRSRYRRQAAAPPSSDSGPVAGRLTPIQTTAL